MNILHLNTSDDGGAARAMIRLSQGLKHLGHDSQMLVGYHKAQDGDIYEIKEQSKPFRRLTDDVLDRISLSLDFRFSLNTWSHRNSWHIPEMTLFRQANVINLHNLHGGYFNYRALPALAHHKPIVWSLHDMWALTGHCAYSYDCERWKTGCFECPLLREPGRQIVEPPPIAVDRSRANWESKRDIYLDVPLHVVAPSKWLYGLAQSSTLAVASSIHYIPYGVNLDVFHPSDRNTARRILGLPSDQPVIFFSASPPADKHTVNSRKGFSFLLQALEKLPASQSIWLMTSGNWMDLTQSMPHLNVHQLGYLSDEKSQQLAFAAADIFVFPSLADNLPLVLIESLACGTPMVAFDVGGVPELVHHMETGYLAHYRDSDDLLHGIQLLLEDESLRARMSQRCRAVAESEYSLVLQVRRYLDVYEEAIKSADEISNTS